MSEKLNLDALERDARYIIAHGNEFTGMMIGTDLVLRIVARIRELERELAIAKGNNAARMDGLQSAISVLEKRAQPAGEAEPEATIFAWATFDGEGSYDLRLFEENESYRRDYIDRNGAKYADWVMPLYRVAAPPAAANQAGVPEEWHALRDAARDFYNATVAQPALRLSSTKKQVSEDAKSAGEALRSALLITAESQARGGYGE